MTTYAWEKKESAGSWVPFEGTPNVQNPSEEFEAGTWDIRVTVSNNGQIAQETKTAYVTVTGGSAYTGPLDLVPGALVAYSQRAMTAGSTANAIRIKRSSDDAEQTFALINNTVSVSAIGAFIGAGTGSIHTHFDLSGNGVNVLDSGGTLPLWVESTAGGKPGGRFDGNTQLLSAENVNFSGGAITFLAVVSTNLNESVNIVWGASDDIASYYVSAGFFPVDEGVNNAITVFQSDSGTGNEAGGQGTTFARRTDYFLLEAAWQFGSWSVRLNGVADTRTIDRDYLGAVVGSGVPFHLGKDGQVGSAMNGDIVELIVYNSILSDENRTALRQNLAAYYAITLS